MRTRVAGIIPYKGGIMLMHRIKKDLEYYAIPGGGLEEGEDLEECCIREIKEELGVNVKIEKLLYEIEVVENSISVLGIINPNQKEYFYLCKYISGEFGKGDGPEYNNDPEYAESGKFLPEIISIGEIRSINLFPPEIKEKLIKDIEEGNIL